MSEEIISIPKSLFDGHVKNSAFLNILYMRGIENWEGYEAAHKYFLEVCKWPEWGTQPRREEEK